MKHGVGPGYNIELVVRREDKEAIQKLARDKLKGQKVLISAVIQFMHCL